MSFQDRQRTLFDTLAAAEENHLTNRQNNSNYHMMNGSASPPRWARKMRSETRPYRGRKSMFSKPEDSIFKCLGVRTLPDFKKNPSKWIHYNLEHVPDVTDRSNAHAAAICMQEIMLAKQKEGEAMDEDKSIDDKVIFKVPTKPASVTNAERVENKSNVVYKRSKIILPEYVVGRKIKKVSTCNKLQVADSNRSELKLHHLIDEDEEDDDANNI